MTPKETAYTKIAELVKRFEEQFESYKKGTYNETQTRRDFIDPFFKALGWDIDNENGYAESYREVIHEDKVKVGKATKAPDYSFRLAGAKRLFFVEAKKPSVLVKDEIQPAYQVRRYGWSAKLAISIITDFEEFAIYDCTRRPLPSDKASVARIKYLTFKEYLKEFDFIWETFSREQVLKGSFDKFVQGNAHKKGTATVDKAFLESLDSWRTLLAENIAKQNQTLDEDEINFAVQQTIDRIIFLRIAEDRSIEPYGNMQEAVKQGDFYKNMFQLFQQADAKYNSGLFDLKKDKISKELIIDNKVLKAIINDLYYPVSPYEFSVLSVEILGSAYEQFLGKQIKIDDKHRARIEEKPEVRKAGGVYYTPQYVVDYIVKNTVGKLVEGKTPKQVSALKIVDPACGSGSFLLGAYQFLLDWHKDYYTQNGKVSKGEKGNPLTPEGHLTTAIKKAILTNNIYGVDIDVNAVEVTKLSLLLKCMEGETEASIASQLKLFHERVLPTLENNIKSGNSLIDTDYYGTQFDFGDEKKIKPFNWQSEFPEVFKKTKQAKAHIYKPDLGINDTQTLTKVEEPITHYTAELEGGFDCVIGNPPYIRIQTIIENSSEQGEYFTRKFKSAQKGNYDIYVIFIEQALRLINAGGAVGYILPHKFFTAQYGEGVREVLRSSKSIQEIIHFGHQQIFDNATTYTCILTLTKGVAKKFFNYLRIDDLENWRNSLVNATEKISYSTLTNSEWNFISGEKDVLHKKLSKSNEALEYVTDRIFQGLKTGADKVFILEKKSESKDKFIVYSSELDDEVELEKSLLHPLIKGGNSKRFAITSSELLILFPYVVDKSGTTRLIEEDILKTKYPKTFNYLKQSRKVLLERDKGKMNVSAWYGYSRNQALEVISTPKIFTPDIAPLASYSIDRGGSIFFTGGTSGGYGIKPKKGISDLFLLGILNSKLADWFLRQISTQMRGGWYSYEAKYIKSIPIKIPSDKKIVKDINDIVDQLLKLNEEKAEAKLPSKIAQLEGKITWCENRINELVYELYELTPEEIKIVEGQ